MRWSRYPHLWTTSAVIGVAVFGFAIRRPASAATPQQVCAATSDIGTHTTLAAESSTARCAPPPSTITQVRPARAAGATFGRAAALSLPTLGTNVRANANPRTFARPQVEPSIASDPHAPSRLVAGFADFQNGPTFDASPGVAWSRNGGATWKVAKGGANLPNPPSYIWGDRTTADHLAAGDSAVTWGLGDTVLFATLGFHDNATPPNSDCSAGGVYVYRSDDGGKRWSLPAGAPTIANTATVFRDKSYIAADVNAASPFAGSVYLVWSDDTYDACPQDFAVNFDHRDIRFSRSTDGGAIWSAPITLATGCLQSAVPAVATNGDVYVTWFDCNSGVRQLVRKSVDGGASFETAVAAAADLSAPPSPLAGSNFRANAFPAIATDATDASTVYVVWSSDTATSATDVFLSRSLDAGGSWSPTPVRVNDDPLGNPRDQFFPWVAVGGDGTVRVMWGDDRLDLVNEGGKLYDVFMAESTDKGSTFGPNYRVSASSSDPERDGFNGTFIGDYFGLSASGVPAWGDTRSGNQDIVVEPIQDLALTRISAPARLSFTAAAPSRTRMVAVQVQNRGSRNLLVADASDLAALVQLRAESLGTCPDSGVVLHVGEPQVTLPATLRPKARMNVLFDVAFDCVNDPAKSTTSSPDHADYRYVATCAPLDKTDKFPANDNCPRSVPPPFVVAPFPNGTIKDKGCGTRKADGTSGADVLTDIVGK